MKRVTGEDPGKLRAWYGEHLDFNITEWLALFNGSTWITGTLPIWQGRSGVRSQRTRVTLTRQKNQLCSITGLNTLMTC